jgi:hypothetical protein
MKRLLIALKDHDPSVAQFFLSCLPCVRQQRALATARRTSPGPPWVVCGRNGTDLHTIAACSYMMPRRPADKALDYFKTTIDPSGVELKPNESQKANPGDLHLAELEDILAESMFQEPHEDSEDQSTTADPPGGELDYDTP